MAFCCPSSSSSSSSGRSEAANREREEALQIRLDQMRRERQSELKQIGRGDHGDGRQESSLSSVQRMLEERLALPSADNSASNNNRTPASSGTSAAAAAIRVEVVGLNELRPVSRVLQSSSFRTELESLVRASLSPRQPVRVDRQDRTAVARQQPADGEVPQQQPPADDRSLTELRRQRHEELVQEINELLHSQLVTGGLDGAFRRRLDRELVERAAALPDGGRRAQSAMQRLPPSGIQRNDFSHLGIWRQRQEGGVGVDVDLFDDAASSSAEEVLSAVSTAAATAAVAAGNAAVTRQLHSVQRELTDVRRTLRLLLGNQLETQRMIRQEVAAALLATGIGQPAAAVPSLQHQPHPPPPSAAGACLICLTSRADTVMYRCGHLCLCAVCTARMKEAAAPSGRLTCPVCRAPVIDTLRVFAASADSEAN